NAEKTQRFLNNILTIFSIISIIIIALSMLGSRLLVKFIAPGLDVNTTEIASQLNIIMLPFSFFLVMSNIMSVYLQAHERFISPALTSYTYGVFGIGSMVLFHQYGIVALAAGSALSFLGMFLIQLPSAHRQGLRYRPLIDLKDEGLKMMGRLLIPVIISSAFSQIYMIVDRIMASGLDQGSITALDYANRVNTIYYNIFVASISTVIFPILARHSGDMDKFTFSLGKALRIASIISLPITAGFIVLRVPVVQLLFEHGAFNKNDTIKTSIALACLAVGSIGIAFRDFINRAFYALKDTKTPMINGIIVIILNIIFSFVLVRLFGIGGLAMGTSIAAIISGIMLLLRIRRKVGQIRGTWVAKGFFQSAIASIIMGIIIYMCNIFMIPAFHLQDNILGRGLTITILTLIGALIYFLVLFIFRMEEVHEAFTMIGKRFEPLSSRKSI
ncbi:MAG TPA: murein biosynthesis integral membrane protein MurJ, partial [Clostridia bacterium]